MNNGSIATSELSKQCQPSGSEANQEETHPLRKSLLPHEELQNDRPVRTLCSENFLQTWPDLVAELGSGRWAALTEKDGTGEDTAVARGSVPIGKGIELVDCPLLDVRGVDIELPNRHAIIVHSATAFQSDKDAKQLVLELARLVVEWAYRCIHIIICCDMEINDMVSKSLVNFVSSVEGLQASKTPCSSNTRVVMASPCSISAVVAASIMAAKSTATGHDVAPPVSVANDEEIRQSARFLMNLSTSFTASGAVQCVQLVKKLAPDVAVVPYVLESVSIRDELIKKSDSSQDLAKEMTPESIKQIDKLAYS
jgi:hypothetical protein